MEELIYDRTQADVDNKTSKGYHNYTDLNRIEEWCKYLADLLTSYGYPVHITAKTDWAISDMRYASEMERIRQNVGKIKEVYYSLATTPPVPDTLNKITWQKANHIEKILADIDLLIKNMEQVFIYTGVSNCGQNRIWQQRFRRGSEWISLSYSLGKYNQEWNTVASPSEENGTLPTDKREKISMTLNLWNRKMTDLDSLVGVIS